jgi:hypothetical protein
MSGIDDNLHKKHGQDILPTPFAKTITKSTRQSVKCCGEENLMAETEAQEQKPKTSKLAIASMIAGLMILGEFFLPDLRIYFLNLIIFCLWILSIPLAPICGIIALIRIKKSKGMLKGMPYAIVGIVAGSFGLYMALIIVSVWLYGI